MTSDQAPNTHAAPAQATPNQAYVWIWLPGEIDPAPAGVIERVDGLYEFNYGRTYLARNGRIPIYSPELPLQPGPIRPDTPLKLANCLRDGSPDTWGRRVIINRLSGLRGDAARDVEFDELTYMLESGSDRIGALDFQASGRTYVAREQEGATLDELLASAEKVQAGEPLDAQLDRALHHGSSIGGARPKALIRDGDKKYIAKFSASADTYSVVKAEYIAMRLAALGGLNVAPVRLVKASGKDVLLVERFDRQKVEGGWARRSIVSALTLFGLHEELGRYASYEDLAEIIRNRFVEPKATLHELYRRLVLNVLVGNIDDHARNHAAFWDGAQLELTPAYDICPQSRNGAEANQAMLVYGDVKKSQMAVCFAAAPSFLLSEAQAEKIAADLVNLIRSNWDAVCTEAALSQVDKDLMWRRQFLNPYAFQDGGAGVQRVAALLG